ncbi:hypothetical protein B6U99_02565 [Candidatus Geothermarchaeota archaeon ex4572_27]|nr:MAG: hypothetical protein B6U99_02565 [Candidatus Geothermarchaeota archaeon ex4572_27]
MAREVPAALAASLAVTCPAEVAAAVLLAMHAAGRLGGVAELALPALLYALAMLLPLGGLVAYRLAETAYDLGCIGVFAARALVAVSFLAPHAAVYALWRLERALGGSPLPRALAAAASFGAALGPWAVSAVRRAKCVEEGEPA